MKKVLALMCAMLLFSGLYSAANKMTIDINVGTMTDKNVSLNPFFWTAGVELDIPIGKVLFFSPEALLMGYKFEFKQFLLFPGMIMNVAFGNFFAGGGVTKGFYVSGGSTTAIPDAFFLKVNGGLMSESLKITAYMITPFTNQAFNDFAVGLTIGFRL